MRIAALALALTLPAPLAAQTGDFITLPNGQRVKATDPQGGRGKVNADGSITYPDGTNVGVGAGDATVVRRADGSTSTQAPPDTFELPNGQQVRATDPSGARGKQNADGSVTYPDGTRVGMGNKGETVIARGDGTVTSRDAPPKAPAGGGTDTAANGWVTLPNGERVPAQGPDGAPGTLMPDGSIRYADGTVITGRAGSETTVTTPDGGTRGYGESSAASGALSDASRDVFDVGAMNAVSDRMLARAKKIADLNLQRENCAKGTSGKACRLAISDAIRALERENKAEAAAYLGELQRLRAAGR